MVIGFLVTPNDDGTFTSEQCFCEKSHEGAIKCMASGKHFVASGATDSSIALYDLSTNDLVASYQEGEGAVNSIVIPDHKHLISGGGDGQIRVWEAKKHGRLLHSFTGQNGPISSIAVHPSGKMCLSVNEREGSVFTWDLIAARKAYVKNFKWLKPEFVRWTASGDHFVLASSKAINVFELKSAACVRQIEMSTSLQTVELVTAELNNAAAVDDDDESNDETTTTSDCLLLGDAKGFVHIVDLLSKKEHVSFKAHDNRVKGICALPCKHMPDNNEDNLWLATASSDEQLKIWKLNKNKMLNNKDFQAECVLSIDTKARLTCVAAWFSSHKEEPEPEES